MRLRASAAGAALVDVRQRHSELVTTLTEQEDGVRLLVLGRRGESAQTTQSDLGRNVERVVRALHEPILTVTEGFREPQRVMIAFGGGIVTRRGVEVVAAIPLLRGLPITLLMSGQNSPDAVMQLSWAKSTLESAGFAVADLLIPGNAESVIAKTIKVQSIDLLIMGAFGHSPLRSLQFGSKTADLLRPSVVPTLLIR